MKRRGTDQGLSLIELVVAMAIFGLVAIMGVQSLSSMLRVRDRLVTIDQETTQLGQTAALMRNDLASAIPMVFFPPDRGRPFSAVALDTSGTFSLSTAGQPGFERMDGFHRVEWRVDPTTQTLNRRIWRTLTPADRTAQEPDALVMTDVTALRVRSYWPTLGWIDGFRNLNVAVDTEAGDGDAEEAAPEVYSDTLPLAIEVTIVTQDHGDIRLVENLQ